MEYVYHIVTIRVNETSWAHVWRLRSRYLRTGYDKWLITARDRAPSHDGGSMWFMLAIEFVALCETVRGN
jgi:hypothetical protein